MTLNVRCKQCGVELKIEVRDPSAHPVEIDACPWCAAKKEQEEKEDQHADDGV